MTVITSIFIIFILKYRHSHYKGAASFELCFKISLKADNVAANNKLFYGLVYLDKSGLFVLVQNGFAVNMVVRTD